MVLPPTFANKGKKRAREDAPERPAPPKKAKAHPAKPAPAPKAAGKARPKFKVTVEDAEDEDDANKENKPHDPSHTGRGLQSKNYITSEIWVIVEYTGEALPVCSTEWAAVAKRYNKWAIKNRRPERNAKALKTKFEQVRDIPFCIDFIILRFSE